MIRNDRERSQTQEERERMARALEDYAGGSRKVIGDEETRLYYEEGVSRREAELSEYQRLKSGGVSRISGEGPNGLGTIITKARIARGMTLADLGEALEMPLQQVQRYESENWRRASLWRLKRVRRRLAVAAKGLPGASSRSRSAGPVARASPEPLRDPQASCPWRSEPS